MINLNLNKFLKILICSLFVLITILFCYRNSSEIQFEFEKVAKWLYPSDDSRNAELTKIALTIVGGLGVLFSLYLTFRKLKATNVSLELQAEALKRQSEQLDLTRNAQVDERFKNAVEHLGDDKEPIILGGVVELHQIAKENNEKYAAVVYNILTAYMRSFLNVEIVRNEKYSYTIAQTIIDFLFRGNDSFLYQNFKADLNHCNLNGLDINGAKINNSDLSFCLMPSEINDVSFEGTKLSRAKFAIAKISNTNFTCAEFHDNLFELCEFRKVDFSQTDLTTQTFMNCKLFECVFSNLEIYNCKFLLSHIENSTFLNTELLKVNFSGSNLINIDFSDSKDIASCDFSSCGFSNIRFANKCFNCNFSGINQRYGFEFIQLKDLKGRIDKYIQTDGIVEFSYNDFLNCTWNQLNEIDYKMIEENFNNSSKQWEAKYRKSEEKANEMNFRNSDITGYENGVIKYIDMSGNINGK